jgi:hypothetical protein
VKVFPRLYIGGSRALRLENRKREGKQHNNVCVCEWLIFSSGSVEKFCLVLINYNFIIRKMNNVESFINFLLIFVLGNGLVDGFLCVVFGPPEQRNPSVSGDNYE